MIGEDLATSPVSSHSRQAGPKEDAGFTLVFFALAVVALMGIAALVVDLGYWYLRADNIQRTADAAALAGVVYMPGDPNGAIAEADKIAKANGFDPSKYTVNVNTNVTDSAGNPEPHELSVSITDPGVPTFFAKVFGMKKITETRSSTAEFQPPIPLGSAENSFGTGNLDLGVGNPTNIWAAVNGYCTSKENGDQFLSGFDGTFTGSGYKCSADQTAPTVHAAANPEYNATGYIYDIVTPNAAGPLDQTITVQAYDPGYNPSEDPASDGTGNSCAAPGSGPSPDNSIGVAGTQMTTNFTLSYNPVPGDPSQNQILNTYSAGTDDQSNCGQWVTIGSIPAGANNGTYQLDVASEQGQLNSEGTNAYGLRVFQGASFTRCSTILDPGWNNPLGQANDCPVIQGDSALSVYANQAGSQGDFYLAKIDQSYANHTLTVNLFDPGEGDHYIELINPDGVAVPFFWETTDDGSSNALCPDCAADFGFLHYAGPTTGTTQLDVSGQINPPSGVTSHSIYNDRHVELTFFIPPDYQATNGGWWKIRYIANSGSISDRTTWQVNLSGSPIHLVPNP